MRGPILFVLFLVAGAATGALVLRPPPAGDPGWEERDSDAPFFRGAFAPDDEDPRRWSFASSETLGFTLTGCATPGTCLAVVGQPRRDVDLAAAEDLVAAEVTVSWSPASAATQRLTVALLACDADSCGAAAEPLAVATGPSPLALAFAAEDALPGGILTLRVSSEDRVPSVPAAFVSPTPQPFAYAGVATFR